MQPVGGTWTLQVQHRITYTDWTADWIGGQASVTYKVDLSCTKDSPTTFKMTAGPIY